MGRKFKTTEINIGIFLYEGRRENNLTMYILGKIETNEMGRACGAYGQG
jgi:hypothetical protein